MYFVATAIVKGKTPCPDRTEIINTRLQDLVAVARLRGDNVVAPIPMDQEVAPFQSDGIVNLATRYPNEPGAVIKDTLRITPRQRRSPE